MLMPPKDIEELVIIVFKINDKCEWFISIAPLVISKMLATMALKVWLKFSPNKVTNDCIIVKLKNKSIIKKLITM